MKLVSENRSKLTNIKLQRIGGGIYVQDGVALLLCQDSIPEPLRSGFWSEVNIYSFFHHPLPQAGIDALLNVGRAHEMAALVSSRDSVLPNDQAVAVAKSYVDHLSRAFSQGRRQGALGMHNFWEMLGVLEEQNLMSLDDIAKLEFPFAKTFRFNGPGRPLAIHRVLASQPDQVLELGKVGFISDTAIATLEDDKLTQSADNEIKDGEETVSAANRETIYHVLDTFDVIPGRDGSFIDENVLSKWIEEVRDLFADAGYVQAYSAFVGGLLALSPVDPEDNIWPHKVVRNIIEKYADEKMVSALITAEFNERDIIMGSMEEYYRKSSDKFLRWSRALDGKPKTQEMLNQIASGDIEHAEWDRQRRIDAAVASGLR